MIELAVMEEYLQTILGGIAATRGITVETNPFPLRRPEADNVRPVPVIYFQYLWGDDNDSIGPGARLCTVARYEVGVLHDAKTFGASFVTGVGSVTLRQLMDDIDSALHDYSAPTTKADGVLQSCERTGPARSKEYGPDGAIYSRDGGIFKLVATKN